MKPTTGDPPALPTLGPGVTRLEADERITGALQSLVLDHVLMSKGDALWVDSRANGTTQPLARLAPSRRALDRIHIARGFTPWQHYSLLQDLPAAVTESTSLVVLPAIDWFYRSDEVRASMGKRMFERAVEQVEAIATDFDVPVLVTTHEQDAFTDPLVSVSAPLECTLTKFGPRFSGQEFETLVYPVEYGLLQTTLAYWCQVLSARHPAITTPSSREVAAGGAH
ncbi:hypothetical protein ACFQH3_17040 [Haladaptatus sp. GCM10025707]|uniref:hypothetical protein n=1 Tax=unclassified Haladaptatus TaxID=2622732 RepID=UPI0023E85181|nr:hypothetical protein [Haladaptatus sp. QDMS2]